MSPGEVFSRCIDEMQSSQVYKLKDYILMAVINGDIPRGLPPTLPDWGSCASASFPLHHLLSLEGNWWGLELGLQWTLWKISSSRTWGYPALANLTTLLLSPSNLTWVWASLPVPLQHLDLSRSASTALLHLILLWKISCSNISLTKQTLILTPQNTCCVLSKTARAVSESLLHLISSGRS